MGLLAIFSYVALVLLKPFLPLFLWSVVLAVTVYPAFDWLRRGSAAVERSRPANDRAGARHRARRATVLITSLIHSLEALAQHVGQGQAHLPPAPEVLARVPVVGDELMASWTQASSNSEAFLSRYSRALLPTGKWLLEAVARPGGVCS